ncbi:MAG TPA: methylaspartate mutase subunit E [Pyrinomonadaceae bacterium]
MSNKGNHTILLGGIGGDSHSVGLNILRQALLMDGYQVRYLGTQNRLEHFSQLAALANVVMISSMDGHAPYYLREFPELGRRTGSHRPLWYLGGNLHLGDECGRESEFLEMGFDRVFVKFIDATRVLEILRRDLHDVDPLADCPSLWEKSRPVSAYVAGGSGSDALFALDVFERERREVLDHWKTGYRAADLASNADFLSRQTSFPRMQAAFHYGKLPTLIQPRSGVSLLKDQIKLFKAFKNAGVPVLSYQVDSLTRNNNYAGAEEAIRHSSETGEMTINGFPVVNHGVPGLRRVAREVGVPLQTRHSTRDPRLLAEISYAGGVTSFEGGSICYNIPYYKDYPLDESIRMWQYVDRLTGLYYEKFGVVLDREYFGTLTATLIPPCLAIAVCLMETLLSVTQGVKCVSPGYAEQGHRVQDIAAIRTLGRMARELLDNLGYRDVQVNTVFHQYMAAFPANRERAADIIYNSAITAAQSGATRIIIKTPSEAIRIPTLADNLHGIDLVQRGMAAAADGPGSDETRIEEECAIIRREVEALLEHTIFCGGGDLAKGIISGFEKGYLDIPFSPSIYNRGEVMTARDREGAVRFLSLGQLPFGRELRQFHQEKMQERRRAEGLLSEKQSYLLIERDVLQMARDQYEEWPLFR